MAIDPRGNDIKQFLADDDGQPVVMLNLLRFAEHGRERYAEYVQHFRATASRFGAELVYCGTGSSVLVAEPGQSWDAVLLVRYPSRQAFSDMIRDQDYQSGTHLRTEALTEAVLQATVEWQPAS